MGRMFRIISDGPAVEFAPAAVAPAAALPEPVVDEPVAPFVEVGGPDGVVSSIPVRPRLLAAPPPEPARAEPPAVEPTRAVGRVLSVSFHRIEAAVAAGGVAGELVCYHLPNHPVSREYREVFAAVRGQQVGEGPRALLFTAAAPAAGTTTVLANLAVTVARGGGVKVLVIDAHPRRPGLSAVLGVNRGPGVAEVLAETVPLSWAVQPSAVEGLHVLAAGDGPWPAEPGLPRLLGQLRQWFDWVLIDGGVWAECGRPATAAGCDATYFVTRQEESGSAGFAGLRAELESVGGRPRGYIATAG